LCVGQILCRINAVASSKSGRLLFGGLDYGAVVVYDSLTGTLIEEFQGHDSAVTCVGVSSDGQALFVGSSDEAISFWS
jgi:guanine nucleotide-binding protein G(I)/G(S)/G(T) subunit beta-1